MGLTVSVSPIFSGLGPCGCLWKMVTWKQLTYSWLWCAHAEGKVVFGTKTSNSIRPCHLGGFNIDASLFLTRLCQPGYFKCKKVGNPPSPSATSFINLSLLPKTGQYIPEGLVYFLLQQRSEWPCRLTVSALTAVPQPLNISMCAACCQPWGLTKRCKLG